ncbi:MAG: HNH endonuclease domain-containing protein [Erysipelotrichaceae bacterium]|nr:HNH endonuclease domain-containing protein [Erysipelotrichaceae bacterium]
MTNLGIQTIYVNNLDLERFSLMLDNNSQCYKFYWLEALVNLLVRDGKKDVSFHEAAYEMIIEAWYTVSEYHLHMGSVYGTESRNAIERAVNYIQSKSDLSSSAQRDKIEEVIRSCEHDHEFLKIINQMTDDVPYRLLSPFVPELKGNDRLWHSDQKLIEYFNLINQKSLLPYYMEFESHSHKYVHWNDPWTAMVKDNYILILEWIRSKKIRYLQDRNPGVPGIVYKLDIVTARKLNHVHHLWDAVMEKDDVIDIYTNNVLNGKRYDIDHFIPWSYVMADELWNLTPAEKASNISKSNHLPNWDKTFNAFVNNQLQLHGFIHKDDHIRELFEKCRNSNLNTLWASDLYNVNDEDQFRSLLKENMRPVYNAARLQGYSIWLQQ